MTNYKSKYLSLLISLKPELENILFNFDNNELYLIEDCDDFLEDS